MVLNIEANTYSLIESGVTKLVDKERIKVLEEKLEKTAFELGIFDGMTITQHFRENEYAANTQTILADNKELVQTLKDELAIKNKQIEQMLFQNNQLFIQNAQLIKQVSTKKN
jgi:hypothetical protein